ncbi:MAG: AP-2 complex subunit sigma [Trizodia sp. TS-e1964]|nr:MAG: AP-2 complex subunit sigma [Trizodia sp. TS-e1964]
MSSSQSIFKPKYQQLNIAPAPQKDYGSLLHPNPKQAVRPPCIPPPRSLLQTKANLRLLRGKTRLAKWYSPYNASISSPPLRVLRYFPPLTPRQDAEKIKLKGEVHRLVAPRDQKHQSNFVEFRNSRIVYRRYAGLFFCACIATNDNELAYLEAIHFFVEVLDAFFGNVCELDLVFNFYKVYAILDEVFLAGEIQEASKQVVLTRLEHLDKLE